MNQEPGRFVDEGPSVSCVLGFMCSGFMCFPPRRWESFLGKLFYEVEIETNMLVNIPDAPARLAGLINKSQILFFFFYNKQFFF